MKPSNLAVLYEDTHIIVCIKPPKIATQCSKIGSPDMVSLLKNHLHQKNPSAGEPYLAVIHRLDQPVSGILVFAKSPFAAKELNRQLTSHGFGKHYRALVENMPAAPEGTLENYLVKDARTNTSRICTRETPDAKLARLHYTIVKKEQGKLNWGHIDPGWNQRISENASSPTELDILLDTGRHHQIRVQLAGIGCPIIGDTKYNPQSKERKEWQNICLCAYKLEFQHPKTHKPMCFELPVEETK